MAQDFLPRFLVEANEPIVAIKFQRHVTSQECDIIEIYFKYLCAYFCDLPQFCFDEDRYVLEILINNSSEYRNFSIFVRLMSSFYQLSSNEKSFNNLNHYRCINKAKLRGKHELIFQKNLAGFKIRYLLNCLFYDSETHWIIQQNKVFTQKITNKPLISLFHKFEKSLDIDFSKPQIVITCAMISDFHEESKQLLNQSFSLTPNPKIVPFWNMFLNKQQPINPLNPLNPHSQLFLIIEIEEKLNLLANKNIQWWILFDYAVGLTNLFDYPEDAFASFFRSPDEQTMSHVEKFVISNSENLFAGFFDDELSIAMLLTFAHFRDFFCSSELNLELSDNKAAMRSIWEQIMKLFNKFSKTDFFNVNSYFIKESLNQKFIDPLTKIKSPIKQKTRLWSDRQLSDDDVSTWEDWSNQIDFEDDYGDIYADEA